MMHHRMLGLGSAVSLPSVGRSSELGRPGIARTRRGTWNGGAAIDASAAIRIEEHDVASETPSAAALIGARAAYLPHMRLMYAVLEDAVIILLGGRHAGPATLRIETVNWVLADDAGWLFSFQNVCDALDVDGDRLRARLAPWLTLERHPRPALYVAR